MKEEQKTYQSDPAADEITLKELAIVIRNFVRQAWRNWYVFAILFALIGGVLLYRAISTPTTYKAKLTFMINEDEGGLSGMAGILGQIGFGGRRGRFNLDKILELSTSRNIVARMAFTRDEVDGQEDYIANHLIRLYEMDEDWKEDDPELDDFRFRSDSLGAFDETQRHVLLKVYRKLIGTENTEGLISNGYSEESSILTISAETIHEDLSIAIVTNLFDELSEFYVRKTIEKQKVTYDIMKAKTDSIVNALRSAERELARFQDQNRGAIMNVDRLNEVRLRSEVTKLNMVHGEALKNLEIADFSLKNATPFIQEIDRPISPLTPRQPSKMKALVVAAILSLVIGGLYLITRNFLAQLSRETDIE